MNVRDRHLTDETLLRALDRELSPRETAYAEAHLAECEPCRGRQAGFDRGAAAFGDWYAGALPDVEASRSALRARLAWGAAGPASPLRRAASVVLPLMLCAGAAAFLLLRVSLDHAMAPLPDAVLTPGATWNVTVAELCAPHAGREHRVVPAAVRDTVLRDYGMTRVPADRYELDYLITPELGGAPDAKNLWPQYYTSTVWNAGVKDELEHLLPRLVCEGRLDLQTAQRDIARDWVAAYKKYFQTDRPLAHAGPPNDHSEEDGELTYPIWRRGNQPAPVLIAVTSRR